MMSLKGGLMSDRYMLMADHVYNIIKFLFFSNVLIDAKSVRFCFFDKQRIFYTFYIT